MASADLKGIEFNYANKVAVNGRFTLERVLNLAYLCEPGLTLHENFGFVTITCFKAENATTGKLEDQLSCIWRALACC